MKVRIADVNIAIDMPANDFVEGRFSAYLFDFDKADLYIKVSIEDEIVIPENTPVSQSLFRFYARGKAGEYLIYDGLTPTEYSSLIVIDKDVTEAHLHVRDISSRGGVAVEVRYFNMMAEVMKYAMIVRDGLVFHSSSLCYKGGAYLFSAPSGTGKSTHTGLWTQYVDGAYVFNDDSPAIRVSDEGVFAYGTPWSGKTDINRNVKLPLKGIVFLNRGKANSVTPYGGREMLEQLMSQSFVSPFGGLIIKFFQTAEKITKGLPVYKLYCDISRDAVTVVKEAFDKEII